MNSLQIPAHSSRILRLRLVNAELLTCYPLDSRHRHNSDGAVFPLLASYIQDSDWMQAGNSQFLDCSEILSTDVIFCAENFDPFTASMQYFTSAVQAIESILDRTSARIIVKTSSPLALLATPLLRQAGIELLYLLQPTPELSHLHEESITTIETLARVGVRTSVWCNLPFNLQSQPPKVKRMVARQLARLQNSGAEIILPFRSHRSESLEHHAQSWIEARMNTATQCAA